MRNIDKEMHKDFWYRSLSERQKLAWLNMITQLADDQGRFVMDTLEIRYKVFSGDQAVTNDEIVKIFEYFTKDGKVFLYEIKEIQYCQIVNWWKYQSSANYMSISKYPAPDGWADCYRYGGKGRKPIISPNWKNREIEGGFMTFIAAVNSVNQPSFSNS